MKQLDFIHKYKHLLPSQYRKDFERDLLSVFVDEHATKQVIETLMSEGEFNYLQAILDIECNPLKEKEQNT